MTLTTEHSKYEDVRFLGVLGEFVVVAYMDEDPDESEIVAVPTRTVTEIVFGPGEMAAFKDAYPMGWVGDS